MDGFELCIGIPIVIYGVNVYTSKFVYQLEQQGYNVLAIVDKGAENLPGDLYGRIEIIKDIAMLPFEVRKKCIIWIILQNAMLHYEIGKYICEQGVERIIFAPLSKKVKDRDLQMSMIEAYNRMINAISYRNVGKIPLVKKKFFVSRNELKVVKEESETVIVFVPSYMIHTSLVEPEVYKDIPIEEFTPYFDLIKYIHSGDGDISEYIEKFGKVYDPMEMDERRKEIINKRKEQIKYLDYEFALGMQYFISGAPLAKWNEKGYFNLCEGQHRCVYLLEHGVKELPIRLYQTEYHFLGRKLKIQNDIKD